MFERKPEQSNRAIGNNNVVTLCPHCQKPIEFQFAHTHTTTTTSELVKIVKGKIMAD